MAKWSTARFFVCGTGANMQTAVTESQHVYFQYKNDQVYFLLKILLSKWIWKGLSIYIFLFVTMLYNKKKQLIFFKFYVKCSRGIDNINGCHGFNISCIIIFLILWQHTYTYDVSYSFTMVKNAIYLESYVSISSRKTRLAEKAYHSIRTLLWDWCIAPWLIWLCDLLFFN
jgi:hypothetical protein